jgi:hypothetical protein
VRPRLEEPPVYRALTFRRGSIGNARFDPANETVIYAASWQGKPSHLYSTRTDSSESTSLQLPDGDLLAVSANGRMAIGMEGASGAVLAEVPLAGGVPRELVEGDVEADYSPKGDEMAVARDGKLEYPAGKTLYDPGPGRLVRGPRFSPDGKWIAFIERQRERASINVIDLSGRKSVLSDGWETTTSLAWHPKTGEVWFSAREFAGFGVVNLHAVSLAGKHRVVARGPLLLIIQDIARDGRILLRADDWTETTMVQAPGAARESDLSWLDFSRVEGLSHDGRLLLLAEGGVAEGAMKGVYLRKTDGSPAVRLGDGEAQALSPDEKWVIAMRKDGIVLLPTGPGKPKKVDTPGFDITLAGWLPDGERIFFLGAPIGHPRRMYVQNINGGTPRPVTPENVSGRSVSPDGKFVFGRSAAGALLYPIEGGEARLLKDVPNLASLGFDAEGKGLFLAQMNVPAKIFRYDIASGRTKPVREITVADPAGAMAFIRIVLSPDGKSYAYTFRRSLSRLYVVEGLK